MVYTVPSAEGTSAPGYGPSFDRGVCQVCLRSPAAPLRAVKHTGMVLARKSATIDATLCQSCGTAIFRQAQAHNLAFGWWGLISFITNFVTLIGNFTRSRKHRMIGSSVEMPMRAPLNPGRPVWQRPQMIVPVAIVAAVAAGAVSSAGRENVRALQAGQCIDIPANGTFSDVALVPCGEPHDSEVVGVLSASEVSSGTDIGDSCAELAVNHVLMSRADNVALDVLEPVNGSAHSTKSPIRAVCVLTGRDSAKLTGHVTG